MEAENAKGPKDKTTPRPWDYRMGYNAAGLPYFELVDKDGVFWTIKHW